MDNIGGAGFVIREPNSRLVAMGGSQFFGLSAGGWATNCVGMHCLCDTPFELTIWWLRVTPLLLVAGFSPMPRKMPFILYYRILDSCLGMILCWSSDMFTAKQTRLLIGLPHLLCSILVIYFGLAWSLSRVYWRVFHFLILLVVFILDLYECFVLSNKTKWFAFLRRNLGSPTM